MTLPVKIAKRIAGKCLYSGCDDDAIDGSDHCAPHDAHERGRDAAKKRRRRQRLADQGLCIIAGCGKKVAKRKRPDGTAKLRPCSGCAKDRRAAAKKKRAVPAIARVVPSKEEIWRADPGTEWVRYRGKGRRGRLTIEEQIDEDLRDLRNAMELLHEAHRRLEELKHRNVIELPAIQREEARRIAGEPIGVASRQLDELVEKYA